jgi:hypothetical protein
MRRLSVLLAFAVLLVSCTPEDETTGSVGRCATDPSYSYNPRIYDQCVAACKKCDHGNTVTCTTSCTLKGAH